VISITCGPRFRRRPGTCPRRPPHRPAHPPRPAPAAEDLGRAGVSRRRQIQNSHWLSAEKRKGAIGALDSLADHLTRRQVAGQDAVSTPNPGRPRPRRRGRGRGCARRRPPRSRRGPATRLLVQQHSLVGAAARGRIGLRMLGAIRSGCSIIPGAIRGGDGGIVLLIRPSSPRQGRLQAHGVGQHGPHVGVLRSRCSRISAPHGRVGSRSTACSCRPSIQA